MCEALDQPMIKQLFNSSEVHLINLSLACENNKSVLISDNWITKQI